MRSSWQPFVMKEAFSFRNHLTILNTRIEIRLRMSILQDNVPCGETKNDENVINEAKAKGMTLQEYLLFQLGKRYNYSVSLPQVKKEEEASPITNETKTQNKQISKIVPENRESHVSEQLLKSMLKVLERIKADTGAIREFVASTRFQKAVQQLENDRDYEYDDEEEIENSDGEYDERSVDEKLGGTKKRLEEKTREKTPTSRPHRSTSNGSAAATYHEKDNDEVVEQENKIHEKKISRTSSKKTMKSMSSEMKEQEEDDKKSKKKKKRKINKV